MVLTNPTHFAVAMRYRPGIDAAPVVLARGRGATAEAIRELAGEHEVPMLSYPELTRALYYTSRPGSSCARTCIWRWRPCSPSSSTSTPPAAAGHAQPPVDVPAGARFDTDGRPKA